MTRTLTQTLTFAALTAAACGAQRPLPQGFRELTASGSGRVIASDRQERSAAAGLDGAFQSLATYFDAAVQPVHTVATADQRNVQTGFTAVMNGEAMRGYAVAAETKSGVNVTLLFDKAAAFAGSFNALSEAWRETLPAAPPETPLQRQRLADGSGAISVPAGWQLNAQNAMVSGWGPEGYVDLGINTQVYDPRALGGMFGFRPPVVSPYGNAAENFREITEKLTNAAPGSVRVLEATRVPWWPQGPAATVHFTAPLQGVQLEGVALVLTQPVGMGTFMYYVSSVSAPAGRFNENLPVLLRIWKSWKTDDRVFQARLDDAMKSMRRVGEIVREVADNQRAAMERSSSAWDHYIRGDWPVEERATGRRADVENADKLVERLNEREGYNRYRVVPYADLIRK
jgi:hypothetical protein